MGMESALQYVAPRVFGMISEKTRITNVRTAEKRAIHPSPKTSSAIAPPMAAPTVWAMVLRVRIAEMGSSTRLSSRFNQVPARFPRSWSTPTQE